MGVYARLNDVSKGAESPRLKYIHDVYAFRRIARRAHEKFRSKPNGKEAHQEKRVFGLPDYQSFYLDVVLPWKREAADRGVYLEQTTDGKIVTADIVASYVLDGITVYLVVNQVGMEERGTIKSLKTETREYYEVCVDCTSAYATSIFRYDFFEHGEGTGYPRLMDRTVLYSDEPEPELVAAAIAEDIHPTLKAIVAAKLCLEVSEFVADRKVLAEREIFDVLAEKLGEIYFIRNALRLGIMPKRLHEKTEAVGMILPIISGEAPKTAFAKILMDFITGRKKEAGKFLEPLYVGLRRWLISSGFPSDEFSVLASYGIVGEEELRRLANTHAQVTCQRGFKRRAERVINFETVDWLRGEIVEGSAWE